MELWRRTSDSDYQALKTSKVITPPLQSATNRYAVPATIPGSFSHAKLSAPNHWEEGLEGEKGAGKSGRIRGRGGVIGKFRQFCLNSHLCYF